MRARMDLTGRTFSRWTVLEESAETNSGRHWLCRCSCGTVKVVLQNSLTRGKSTSCGCYNLEQLQSRKADLTGRTFGRLTAVEELPTRRHTYIEWRCQCRCGNETIVTSHDLLCGNIKSCGCLNAELRKKRIAKVRQGLKKNKVENVVVSQLTQKLSKTSKTGVKGVNPCKQANGSVMYSARIGFKGKNHHLGFYHSVAEAEAARKRAEKALYEPYIQKLAERKKTKN